MSNDIERVTKMAEKCGADTDLHHRGGQSLTCFTDTQLLAFEQLCIKEKDEEIARLKESTITHDEWYAQCNEIESLRAKLAMQAEALKHVHACVCGDKHPRWSDDNQTYHTRGLLADRCEYVINATSEEVAKWEATRKAEIEKGVLSELVSRSAFMTGAGTRAVISMMLEERRGVR